MKPARAPAQINCTMAHYIPEGGGGVLPYKNDGVLVVPSLGVKNAVLVAFKVLSFKTSSVVAFVVPLRVEIR